MENRAHPIPVGIEWENFEKSSKRGINVLRYSAGGRQGVHKAMKCEGQGSEEG